MSDKFDFKAFEDDRADQLLRETLAGYRTKPSPGLWKGISRKLLWKELIRLNFSNLSPKYWIAGTAGLLMIAASLYVGFSDSTPENIFEKPAGNVAPVGATANVSANSNTELIQPHVASQTGSDRISVETHPAENNNATTSTLEKSAEQPNKRGQKSEDAFRGILQQKDEAISIEMVSALNFSDMQNIISSRDVSVTTTDEISRVSPVEATALPLSPALDTIITISNAAGVLRFRKDVPATVRFFSAGFGITPELAFYDEPDVYTKTNYWLNGGLTYHVSRFSIATGAGLGYVFDDGKYKVDYKSYDSIGYFNGVVSYSTGSNNEIIYNTQTVNVYDSLKHLADYRTKNRYTYLQVPLLFGYRFFESNRVSLTFQAGPTVSFLLGSRKSDPVIEYNNATIIRVDNETPSRIQTNWQIWANLYFEIRMNKLISIYLEPSFKYYLKPMVTQENVKYKAPWTIGLGVGIQLNFGSKKTSP